ncbi:hypothetical protein C0J50_0672 [Silurus asotus]|uniref:Uncharacterized protein n=1 Tax=Silurus asotus TaxID=30991 RepID=A0AAD5A8J6_SILAS|nr:hypothetical protein C0J50_0672 [Silurus asotus]
MKRARALASHLHTVIKFRLSTAPFLVAAFFRQPAPQLVHEGVDAGPRGKELPRLRPNLTSLEIHRDVS